jgi:hypothetical protein
MFNWYWRDCSFSGFTRPRNAVLGGLRKLFIKDFLKPLTRKVISLKLVVKLFYRRLMHLRKIFTRNIKRLN